MLKNGNECYCFDKLPFEDLLFVKDADEADFCNIDCDGQSSYKCGGATAYSIYVASM